MPVPADTWPGPAAEGRVFYVWFDAPVEYVGATREWTDADPGRLPFSHKRFGDTVPEGTGFTVPPVLFAKITPEELAAFVERFGGRGAGS